MKLSKTDRIIIDSYAAMIESLASYLGSAYEISLHSLEDYNHSVVKIMNGYHSGRYVGAPLTDLALNMLKRIQDEGTAFTESYTSYFAINPLGESLKSSTIPIMGERGRLIGMLCINLYMDTPLSEILQSLTDTGSQQKEHEHFAQSSSDAISDALNQAKNQVMHNVSIPAVNKNKEIIRILYDKGIFKIKNSVSEVANGLGISKNTVYLHIRGIAENNASDDLLI